MIWCCTPRYFFLQNDVNIQNKIIETSLKTEKLINLIWIMIGYFEISYHSASVAKSEKKCYNLRKGFPPHNVQLCIYNVEEFFFEKTDFVALQVCIFCQP